MKRRYLVIETVEDCKLNVGSIIVLGSATLDDNPVRTVEAIQIDEQTAQGFRETMRQWADEPRKASK